MVPISVTKTETNAFEYNRRNKSLLTLNEKSTTKGSESEINYSLQSMVSTSQPLFAYNDSHSHETTGSRNEELSVGSPALRFANLSNNQTIERVKQFIYNNTNTQIETIRLTANHTPNSIDSTLAYNSNTSMESTKTKSPFDYYSVINEYQSLNTTPLSAAFNQTYQSSIISSTAHQINRDISSTEPELKRLIVSTTPSSDSETIPASDKSDHKSNRLIMGSTEPVYGERLPKYIPPQLYQKYPTNNSITTGVTIHTTDEFQDDALYDDEIASVNQSALPIDQSIYSLTTGASLEATTTQAIVSQCMDNEFHCGSGECLPLKAQCNRRVECTDGSDEQQCTCAAYLKADRQLKKLCDGVIDCHDLTDEIDCSYCKGNYVCAQSHVCIDKSKVCNGDNDCPNGEDESECIALVPEEQDLNTTQKFLNPEGALYIHQKGQWAPLCMDDINARNDLDMKRTGVSGDDSWKIEDLGKAICRANSYSDLQSIQLKSLTNYNSSLFYKMFEPNDRISPQLSMY